MAARISYYINNDGKNLKDILLLQYTAFKSWYLEMEESSRREFSESFGNESLLNFFRQAHANNPFEEPDNSIMDILVSEFVSTYCLMSESGRTLLQNIGPSLNKDRYVDSSKIVHKTKDHPFILLWDYLVVGRSVSGTDLLATHGDDCRIGFLHNLEQIQLRAAIIRHFGSPDQIKEKYWSRSEKKNFERAILQSENGAYSLSGHNPKSSGLEWVLEVLEEIKDRKSDLITLIE